jgi:predicted neuraminidase
VRFYEHMFVELRDARLWMLMRTRSGIAESFSSDAGRTWSEPRGSTIENPSARFFIRRLASGRLLLVKNGPVGKRTSRSHMTAFLSSDDGKTWSDGLLLDERGLLSYPDGFQSPDGLIRILYDWNRHGDAEILMAAFREEDVLAGKIVSPDAKTRFVVNKARAPHLSQSIVPDPQWAAQTAADAKSDFSSIPHDGVSSNQLVTDTVLRETPDGSWVLSAMVEDVSIPVPSKDAFIMRSRDKGKTWTGPEPLNTGFPREGKTLGLGPPEIVVHGRQSMLFFSTHAQDWSDNWRTWFCPVNARLEPSIKPSPVVGRLEHRTFIRNHIITRDGNIMVPFQHYEGGKNDNAAGQSQNAFTDPRIGVLISSTGGETWTAHGDIRLAPVKRRFGWEESNLIELADGRIIMLIRQARHMGMVYRAESTDGGKTWPEVASLYRAPNHGTETYFALDGNAVAMIHNPAGRLALWISFDGMRSWPYQRILMQTSSVGPKHYMSYPHGFVSSDKQWLHFAYVDSSQRAAHFSAKLPPLK